MMQSQQQLTQEIRGAFECLREANEVVPKGWVINAVVSAHPGIEGEDRDFALLCVYKYVTREVEALFRSLKAATEQPDSGQFTIPGFDHLQSFYIVERQGEPVAVRLDSLTDEEIDEKAAQLRAMAVGLQAHADELIRFKSRRRAGAA